MLEKKQKNYMTTMKIMVVHKNQGQSSDPEPAREY